MDAETVARKLEPLMPQRVERWRRHRELADPELRALLDRQLLLTARKVLGEPGARPLLSLPPEGVIRGRFHVGRVLYESEKWEAGLRESELIQHALICGRSGSGKSNLAFHLMSQLVARRVPFLFLDMKR
ncbi:MAG TPA: DUF87 domain-containing protein, partial [Phycisphaerales bacterium]|nr:DUF87 domain-containing protein [Phycisphaerales bacterium]